MAKSKETDLAVALTAFTGRGPVQVQVVKRGYATTMDGQSKACGSVTLLKCPGLNILVDCGNPSDKFHLDVPVHAIFITHWHTDHCGRICDFPDTPVYDSEEEMNQFLADHRLSGALRAHSVSGHSAKDNILLVDPNGDNSIAICGDVFEDETDFHSATILGPSQDNDLHHSARDLVRVSANVIVPGHGAPFLARPLDLQHVVGSVRIRDLSSDKLGVHAIVWGLGRVILVNAPCQAYDPLLVTDLVILKPTAQTTKCMGLFNHSRVYMSTDVYVPPDIYGQLSDDTQPIPGHVKVERGPDGLLEVSVYEKNVVQLVLSDAGIVVI